MKTFVLLLYFFRVCLFLPVLDGSTGFDEPYELREQPGPVVEMINGTLRNIVKKYYCSADYEQDEQTILYGTKSWTFPIQDVNLTLSYPSANADYRPIESQYIITGVLVILYIDGPQSRGFINRGGILQDSISMTFLVKSIKRLSYQFWVYGVNKPFVNLSEFSSPKNMC